MRSSPTAGQRDAMANPGHRVLKTLLLTAASAFIAVNIWTGAPVLALWIGSTAVGQRELSMTAVFVVLIVLAALELGLVLVLARVNSAHDALTGRHRGEQRMAWLRSMNAHGQDQTHVAGSTSTPERIVIACVYVVVIGFIVWFFGFAGSPLPS
jgi:hypothetical protein